MSLKKFLDIVFIEFSSREAMFYKVHLPKSIKKVTQECYMESMDAFSKLFEDKVFYTTVMDAISREAYKDLRNRK